MNRIHLPSWSASSNTSSKIQATEIAARSGAPQASTPRYQLFAPLHYEPNYSYPLIVWLHGPDDNDRQLQQVMPKISLRNYVGIGPRGTCRAHDDSPFFRWGHTEASLFAAEDAVFACIDIATQRMNINTNRIFLAGLGCGGTMAFRVGLRHPRQFAGVLSIGGGFPTGRGLLGSLPALRNLPLFIAQGRESSRYSVDRLCDDLRLFHAAGLSATVRQYPCADELTTQMLHDLDVWVMERVTGQSHAEAAPAMSAIQRN